LNWKNALFESKKMHFSLLSVPNMCNLNITFYLLHFKGIEKEVIKEKRGKRRKW